MIESQTIWKVLSQPHRNFPADLAAVIFLVLATNVSVLTPAVRDTPLRIPFALAFILFAPGYVFVAMLFPQTGETPSDDSGTAVDKDVKSVQFWSGRRITGIERLILSFGLSIAVVPLIALVLNYTPWGVQLTPLLIAVSGVVLLATIGATIFRLKVPSHDRFRIPYRAWYAAVRSMAKSNLFETDTRVQAGVNVLLVLAVVLAIGGVGYALMAPADGEQFSAIYLLSEEDDSELVANEYPTELMQGESQEFVFGVDNHEHRTVEYSVVVVEQQVVAGGNETVVEEQREINRFEMQIDHNESWHYSHEVEPTMTGDDVRFVWLLYPNSEVPDEPSMESADYHVHLWAEINED